MRCALISKEHPQRNLEKDSALSSLVSNTMLWGSWAKGHPPAGSCSRSPKQAKGFSALWVSTGTPEESIHHLKRCRLSLGSCMAETRIKPSAGVWAFNENRNASTDSLAYSDKALWLNKILRSTQTSSSLPLFASPSILLSSRSCVPMCS